MRYQYKEEWYENLPGVPKPSGTADECTGAVKLARRGVVTTLASLALCVAASYMACGIIGTGSLAADVASSPSVLPTSPSVPMSPSDADASYVMSWVYDDGMGGGSNDIDKGDDGADNADGEVKDEDAASEHEEYIRELAAVYIAEHTPGGGS